VDEFGGSRLQSIPLVRAARIQEAAQEAGGNGPGPQPQAPAAAPEAPRVLRRGAPATAAAAGTRPPAAPPAQQVNPRSPSYTTGTRPR
jgi:hypothetical protein